MDCFVINLARDKERWEQTSAALRPYPWLRVHRVEAIDGRTLMPSRIERDRGDPRFLGRLGGQLSHAIAWREAMHTPGPYSLILEDDSNPHDLDLLTEAPDGYDIVWVNDRACQARRDRENIGTDGYLVSPTGAEWLLDLFNRDGFGGHLDARMWAYKKDGSLGATTLDRPVTYHDMQAPSSRHHIDVMGRDGP